jgi:hypothetical protein
MRLPSPGQWIRQSRDFLRILRTGTVLRLSDGDELSIADSLWHYGVPSSMMLSLSGAAVTASGIIPAHTMCVTVRTRVVETVRGVDAYVVGLLNQPDAYGRNGDLSVGSRSVGVILGWSGPYQEAMDIVISADNGQFAGGRVEVEARCLGLD